MGLWTYLRKNFSRQQIAGIVVLLFGLAVMGVAAFCGPWPPAFLAGAVLFIIGAAIAAFAESGE